MNSAVSGLRNQQVAMDVIGNNIANVNTTGFKGGRVTFEEAMSQTLQGAARPIGGRGGLNPEQIGLGSNVGSIDTMMGQGVLQRTDQITDLAIQGNSYFVFSNGNGNFYGRNGALQIDANGTLVSSTNGFGLQGYTAAQDGTYPAGGRLGDIRIPYGDKAPAHATTEVKFQCNLDSDSEALGTVTHTSRFLAVADGGQTLTALNDANGNSLGIQTGDDITVAVTSATGAPVSRTFRVGTDITSLNDLAVSVTQFLTDPEVAGSATGGAGLTGATAALNPASGRMEITGGAVAINGLQVNSSRPVSNSFVTSAFAYPSSIAVGTTQSSGTFLRPAIATDLLGNVLNAQGLSLGFEAGDVISINGAVGGQALTSVPGITYVAPDAANPAVGTTMGELINGIQAAFRLPPTDGTQQNNPSVSINGANTPGDLIPDGSIVIRGQPELAFALSGVSITAENSNANSVAPSRFIANMAATLIQDARDTGVHSTSIQVYDQSGDAHSLVMTFTHSGTPNEWLWQATTEGGENILNGGSGRITFGQDGSPASFTYADGSTSMNFDPMNGSNIVSINLDTGTPGSFLGVTQQRSETTTKAIAQDGFTMGKLQKIDIDEKGEVMGTYTNGVTRSIARIALADFKNPAGLTKLGDSMFATSSNSGMAVLGLAGIGTTSTIKAGAIEMSNVDLAAEFTSMITTQRAYQANARVITTSDQMMQELVQLIR
jgi:flagellar hook protein FlgE